MSIVAGSAALQQRYLRGVYAGDCVALARLDPFVVDEEAGRLSVFHTIWSRKVNAKTGHVWMKGAEASGPQQRNRRDYVYA